MNSDRFVERLQKHPNLKERFEALLDIAENTTGEFETADAAEEAVIREVRKTGNQLLTTWANAEEGKKSHKASGEELNRHSKKNSTGRQHMER